VIGAAANVGFLLAFLMGSVLAGAHWRVIVGSGAAPALLALFIMLVVPESGRWQAGHRKGTTSHWNPADLAGVAIGICSVLGLILLWANDVAMPLRIAGTLAALLVTTLGFLFPVMRYLQRVQESGASNEGWQKPIGMMLLGACLSGVPLIVTWASAQWAPIWAEELVSKEMKEAVGRNLVSEEIAATKAGAAKANTGMCMAFGAVLGTIAAAMLGNVLGRRKAYFLLTILALGSVLFFFQVNERFDWQFLVSAFAVGTLTASFYGWLPLYLPELFAAGMRATGQGFSYNFGRILAAVGALQTGYLMNEVFNKSYPRACSLISVVYVVGMAVIWLAPETRGKPLPD
jgi:hypothetical protein